MTDSTAWHYGYQYLPHTKLCTGVHKASQIRRWAPGAVVVVGATVVVTGWVEVTAGVLVTATVLVTACAQEALS